MLGIANSVNLPSGLIDTVGRYNSFVQARQIRNPLIEFTKDFMRIK
jgi:hypothetical protein